MLSTLGLIVVAGACGGSDAPGEPSPVTPVAPEPRQAPVTLDVLFIGNSLTYYNDLPGTVAAIARAGGDEIHVSMVAGPKLTLMDQVQPGGQAETAIRRGRWDFVVLQQSVPADSAAAASMLLAAERFDTMIRSVGARPALYMAWPAAGQPAGFCLARAAFGAAAAAVGGVLLPAGTAWAEALQRDDALPLYDRDGVHPAPLGTWLAALTIYDKLTGHDGRLLAPQATVEGVRLELSPATVRMLQDVAFSAARSDGGSADSWGSCLVVPGEVPVLRAGPPAGTPVRTRASKHAGT